MSTTHRCSACLGVCVVAWVVGASCGGTPPPEPTLSLTMQPVPAPDAAVLLQQRISFADGASLSEISYAPAQAKLGEAITLRFTATGAAGGPARVGLLPPVEAGRQFITDMGATREGGEEDPRVRWQKLTLGEGAQELSFELPLNWNPRTAVFVLERRAEVEGPPIEVIAGPRTEAVRSDGYQPGVRALLAAVPVATEPLHFEIAQANESPTIDGVLDEETWQRPGMFLVESLEGEPTLVNESELWFAWDSRGLYVAARLEDGDIWSEYEQRDDPLYRQEAFELFVAGGPSVEDYLEYQLSARDVVFDAAFHGRRKGDSEFNGAWQHAVQVRGSVNERRDTDEGWSLEMAFSWAEICANTRIECPVATGAKLRVNAFRLDKDSKGRQTGYALTPTRQPDFHNWAMAAYATLGGPA